MIMIAGLLAYELFLIAIRFFKSGPGGALGAWPLYLGVLAGSRFMWLDGWVRRYLPHKLFTQNVLFMPMWLILAVFAFTSTSGWFPKGAILGMGWQWFVKPRNEKLLVAGYGAVFCLVSFLV